MKVMKIKFGERRASVLLMVALVLLIGLAVAVGTAQAASGPQTGNSSIGDYVWHDTDLDGLQDPTENGINGVTVELLDSGGSTVLATAVTAGNGNYAFGGLSAGSYQVRIADSNFQPGGVLYQYGLTSGDFYGPNPNPVTVGDNEYYQFADFGYAKSSLELTKTISLDGNCPGASNVTVLPGTEVTYCYEFTNTGDTYFPGTGFTFPPLTVNDNVLGTICQWSEGAGGDGLLGPGESGSCQSSPTTLSDSVCNTGTVIGTPTDSKPNQLTDFSPAIAEDEACATVVNLRISITPGTATNAVGENHTFTVKVEKMVGAGNWMPVQGATPSVSFTPAPDSVVSSTCPAGTDANGECTVTINNGDAEVITAHAEVTVTVEGLSITRETGGTANLAAGGSDDATKTYVDLRISITPGTATNKVGDAHTFTVKVEQKVGNGSWTPVQGVNPVVTITPAPDSVTDNCASTGTNASGECTVVINNDDAEVFTAHAEVTATVSGQSITRETGGARNAHAGGSGDATKTYVDLRISITPGTATNKVGDAHTFTVKVEQKVGNGSWTPVQGVNPAVTITPAPDSKTDNCASSGTNASGECTVVISNDDAEVFTAHAEVTATVSGQSITRETGGARNANAGGSGDATKTYVDLRISITPGTATNKVGDAHTFTVKVEQKVGNGGWTPVQGVNPTVTVSPAPDSVTDNCASTGTNASGECTVVINNDDAEVFTAHAEVTATVSGQSITRETGGTRNAHAGGSGDATKTYVDLRISITPGTATNKVGDAHTFTVKVEQKVGNGSWTPVQGVNPVVTITPTPDSVTDNCASTGTNASGECTVVINNDDAEVFTAHAEVTATVSGQSITRETGGARNANAGGSGDATKTYVDLRISITPGTATNNVRDPHTFTVKVEQKVGNGAWTPVQGVNPAVTITPAPDSKTDNCASTGTDASGECTVVINSNSVGVFTAHAEVTVTVSGQPITRETGGARNANAGGSDDATKTYVAAKIGDYVWEDIDGDGTQNDGNTGINGVTVELWDAGADGQVGGSDDTLFATTTTANDGGGNPGYYLFENVVPGASYYVKFIKPSGYDFTVQGPTGSKDATDSDADRTTGVTEVFTVAANETDLSWDAGLYQPVTLGDQTFVDTNGDNLPTTGELLLNGVVLEITGPDGSYQVTTSGGAFVPDDNYLESGLRPGTYTVTVVSIPTNYLASGPTVITHTLQSGDTNLTFDFPFINTTAVGLLSFSASRQSGTTVISWATVEEAGNEGFYVLRSTSPDGAYQRISELIPSQAPAGGGASYTYVDDTVQAGVAYWYKIESSPDGVVFGPVGDNGGRSLRRVFMPIVAR